MQPKISFAIIAAVNSYQVCYQLLFLFINTVYINKCAKPHIPKLCLLIWIFYTTWRTLHLSLLNFVILVSVRFSNLSRSFWILLPSSRILTPTQFHAIWKFVKNSLYLFIKIIKIYWTAQGPGSNLVNKNDNEASTFWDMIFESVMYLLNYAI